MNNPKNIWLLVCNNKNWDIAVANGAFGIDKAPGRIKEVRQGDKYVLYLVGIGFVGWGDITGPYYESNRKIWKDKKYKYRFSIAYPEMPGKVLSPATIKDDLVFIKDKKKWPVHFRGGVLKIPYDDFERIKKSLIKSNTSFNELSDTTKKIGDELHNRIYSLFEDMGFSILESNYTKPGPDLIVEDPEAKENSKIIIQCKNTKLNDPTYPSLQNQIHEYSSRIKTTDAAAAIIVLSGFKLSKQINPKEILKKFNVAIWTEEMINYYEDLAKKISGFARYQLLADMGLRLKFDDDYSFDAVQVKQNNCRFYVFAVEPDWLLKTTSVIRRINFAGKINGYQRLLKINRVKKDIPEYLSSEDWIFPNAIVCATQDGINIDFDLGKINFPSRYGSFWIVDGQHRLYGFANSNARLNKENKILCAAIDTQFLGENYEAKQAKIFMDLNMHAKKVDRSLLFELQSVLGLQDLSLKIVLMLGKEKIFRNSIKSYSDNKQGSINLTTFATNQAIKKLTSANGPLLINKKLSDSEIPKYCFSKILNYFKKVSDIFKKEWSDPSKYILKTDRGVIGLLNLYIKIIERYEKEKNIEEKIIEVLKALQKSKFQFELNFLEGNYLGAGGPVKLAGDWSSYITKEIKDFDLNISEKIIESFDGKFGDLNSKLKILQDWFSKLEGNIRGQLMHADKTTFDFLRYLNKDKVKSIKIFIGDISDEKSAKEELKRMKEDGFNIVLTKAKKPEPYEGALFHTRWIASDKYQICPDCDLKEKMIKNSTNVMRLIEWKDNWQLKKFDNYWLFAEVEQELGKTGYRFEYNWG